MINTAISKVIRLKGTVNSYEELVEYMEREGIKKIATDKVLELINESFIDNSVNEILDNIGNYIDIEIEEIEESEE